jgi:hypothetical protein
MLAAAVVLAPISGFSQYIYQVDPLLSYFSDGQRYDIGGGVVLPGGEFTGVVRVTDNGTTPLGDSTAKRSLSTMGYGGTISVNLPFKGTGHISCWAVHVQLTANQYTWTDLNETMNSSGVYKPSSKSLDASTIQVMLPIGIDWKVGNDAIKSKRLAFGLSLGAGVAPQFNITGVSSVSTTYESTYGWGFTPYAKIDWSIFAGLCWKIRAMYQIGKVNILDVNGKVVGANDGTFTISSTNAISLSLLVMPFSGRWSESQWYNTHDTYNQHDRFN